MGQRPSFAQRVVHWAVGHGLQQREWQRRSDDNVLAFLNASLPGLAGLEEIVDPDAFVEFMRKCLAHQTHQITEIKRSPGGPEGARLRFSTLLDRLQSGAIAVPFRATLTFARIADAFRSRTEPIDGDRWAGDLSLHFAFSSSLAQKGRLLWNVVRTCRSTRGLELGTAYGMSALFLLDGMKAVNEGARLTTIEAFDPQCSAGFGMLQAHFGDELTCVRGRIEEVLPNVIATAAPFDYLFHDAAHSGKVYERDFGAIVDHLQPGAIVIFDDIRWEDSRFSDGPAGTYAGWTTVVAHPRIIHAVEINRGMGMALVS